MLDHSWPESGRKVFSVVIVKHPNPTLVITGSFEKLIIPLALIDDLLFHPWEALQHF
jgi:hypothetical protein